MQDGVGRRIGEMTETLFSVLKPLTRQTRYMTLANWHDCLNQLFELQSRIKQQGFVELLSHRIVTNTKKLGGFIYVLLWHVCGSHHFVMV